MPPFAEKLRDIHGIDPVPWWPLAPGWWLVAGFTLIAIALGMFLLWQWHIHQRDWRRDARQRLRQLAARIHQLGAKELAAQLAELLRRVAMARHGRIECASLIDQEWLAWLSAHDPAGFSWTEHGRALIELPYAPPRDQLNGATPEQFRVLINAVLPWLEKPAAR